MDTTNLTGESEYLGITEAADYLRVSASTLRRWEKKGFLVPERTPTGIRRYTKKQLDDVIQTPAYEKPVVTTPAYTQTVSVPTNEDFQETSTHTTVDSVPIKESVEEYIHVVETDPSETIAQHTIDSQIDARPASYTSTPPIDHGYTPLEYSNQQEIMKDQRHYDSFSFNKDTHENTAPPMREVPPDNFATVEQQQFNHIFDIQENEMEEQVELEEYDTDAAYVNDEPRTSTYAYGAPKEESPVKSKKTQSWVKPVFLFASLFLAIVIISLVAWFALSSNTVSGAPLNPVID